jgi:hypothetical protein
MGGVTVPCVPCDLSEYWDSYSAGNISAAHRWMRVDARYTHT